MRTVDMGFVLLATVVVCFTALEIVGAVTHVREKELSLSCDTQEGGWKPPRISLCEKEMWDRIRGKCGE
jgi:hypothetical protein